MAKLGWYPCRRGRTKVALFGYGQSAFGEFAD